MPKIRAINVTGRRWFQRTYGNTYNSFAGVVFLDDGTQREFHGTRAYGYGDYYLQRATDELERMGFMPDREQYPYGGAESAWSYFHERGIPFTYSCADVARQKDL